VNDPLRIGTELFYTDDSRRPELLDQSISDLFPATREGEEGAGYPADLQHRPERSQISLFRDHERPSPEAPMKGPRQHGDPERAIRLAGGELRRSSRAGHQQDRIA
jgi:hypothetical protein